MTLLYRAIWEEDRSKLDEIASEAMLSWMSSKGIDLSELHEGDTSGEFHNPRRLPLTPDRFEMFVSRAENDGVAGLRIRLTEHRVEVNESWTTKLTVLFGSGPGGSLWVDVERESGDPFAILVFKAPRLVKTLLETGLDPRVGSVRLSGGPAVINASGLAGLVGSADRRLPLVVFSHDRAGIDATAARARAAYDQLAGAVQIYVLPPEEVDSFKELVGDDLAVWGGAARLYLPNRGVGGLSPRRHRYVSGQVASRSPQAAAERFAEILVTTATAIRPPALFDTVRRQLREGVDRDAAELLEMAEAEAESLREKLADLQDDLLDAAADNEDLAGQVNVLTERFVEVARATGGVAIAEDVVELPEDVSSISEALEFARDLSHLSVHPEAPVDIEKLDSRIESGAWGRQTWRGLRALNEYAATRSLHERSFFDWCKNSGSPRAWSPTEKKLSMTEGEGVLNNDRLRAQRWLPVDRAVDPSGHIEMLAHLKISQGQGRLTPRMYFHDDTRGVTGKVHIGFIGPHEHMENLSTN